MRAIRAFRSCVGLAFVLASACSTADDLEVVRGDEDLTGRPDLIVNQPRLQVSLQLKTETFRPYDCAVIEGCVTGHGPRRLLRFDTVTPNIGDTNLELGDPDENDHFEYSTCHEHYHFSGYVSYGLLAADGVTVVVPGRKQAFCLRDSGTYLSGAGPSMGYTCDNQGLTAGWQDVYPRHLECQWLDVTGVPPGQYYLRLEVNPETDGTHKIAESRYDNNAAMVPVTITVPDPRDVEMPDRPSHRVDIQTF
jgi:hypothetical protein